MAQKYRALLLAYYEFTLKLSKTPLLRTFSKGRITVDKEEYVKIVKYYDALFGYKVQFNLAFTVFVQFKRQGVCRKIRKLPLKF